MKNSIHYGDAIALNCNLDNLATGSPLTVQLSPFGEFVLHDGGKMNGTVQRCSREAFEAMVANWKAAGSPEILVDVDHGSATGRSTEAAAWAKNLRVEDCGLCADFELTPRGRDLTGGRQYRFVSPGWTLAKDGTPLALCSVGLTNTPNLPVKPVVNAGDAGGRDPDDPNNTKETNTMDIKVIAAALGGEHVKCDAGTLSFGVTRVFPTVDAATEYAMVGHRAEPCEGALTVDGQTVYPKAVVTAKQISQVGVAVAVNYTIQG